MKMFLKNKNIDERTYKYVVRFQMFQLMILNYVYKVIELILCFGINILLTVK